MRERERRESEKRSIRRERERERERKREKDRECEREIARKKQDREENRVGRFKGYQIREKSDKFSSRKKQRSSVKHLLKKVKRDNALELMLNEKEHQTTTQKPRALQYSYTQLTVSQQNLDAITFSTLGHCHDHIAQW